MNTVLVVDDSAVDRRLAGGLLEQDPDWSVAFAVDGKGALEQVAKFATDVVVTDLSMPAMDGLELVAVMRKEYPRIPVILMTGLGSEEIAVKALEKGAASYVPKLLLAQDLLQTVGRLLDALGEERLQSKLLSFMTRSECEFQLKSDLTLVLSAVAFLRQGLTQLHLCNDVGRLRVGVAVEEALLNAYYHGNMEVSSELRDGDTNAFYELARQRALEAPYWDRTIHVTAKYTPHEARFTIRDEGPGFNLADLPDPTDPANLERPYGRGILLMRTFMDSVEYNAAGNEVTMVKHCETNGEK